MEIDERAVGRRRVLVAALVEVELRQVTVDPILVPAASVRPEVLLDDAGTAEVREADADDSIRVRDPPLFVFVGRVVEVVPGRDLVVEERDELVERLFVEILLVVGPAELVQGELVVLGASSRLGDRRVALLGLEPLLPGEEVLRPPELNLVDVLGVGVVGDQPLHDRDGLVDAPDLVECARLLVKHRVVVRVVRIVGQDLVVELDGIDRPRQRRLPSAGQIEGSAPVLRPEPGRSGGASFEVRVGLGARRRSRAAGPFGRDRFGRGGLRRRKLRLLATEKAVLLLQLEIREAAHRLRRECGLRRFLEELLVPDHRLVEAVLDAHLGHVGLHAAQLRERAAVGIARAGRGEGRCEEQSRAEAAHRFSFLTGPAPSRRGRSCRRKRTGPG